MVPGISKVHHNVVVVFRELGEEWRHQVHTGRVCHSVIALISEIIQRFILLDIFVLKAFYNTAVTSHFKRSVSWSLG